MKFKNGLKNLNINIPAFSLAFSTFTLVLLSSKNLELEYSKFEYNLAAFINPAALISSALDSANKEKGKTVEDIDSLVGEYLVKIPKYNGMPFTLDKDKKNLIVKVNSLSCSTINKSINSNKVNYGCKEINSYIGDEKFTEFVAFYNYN